MQYRYNANLVLKTRIKIERERENIIKIITTIYKDIYNNFIILFVRYI